MKPSTIYINIYIQGLLLCLIMSCSNSSRNDIKLQNKEITINQFLIDNINSSNRFNKLFLNNLGNEPLKSKRIAGINCNIYDYAISADKRILVLEDVDTKYKVFIDCEFDYCLYSSTSFREKINLPSTYPLVINNSLSGLKDILNQSKFVKEQDSIPMSSIDSIIQNYLGKSYSFTKVTNENIEKSIMSYKSSIVSDTMYKGSLIEYTCAVIRNAVVRKGTIIYLLNAAFNNRDLFFVFSLETKFLSDNDRNILVKKYLESCDNKNLFFDFTSYVL